MRAQLNQIKSLFEQVRGLGIVMRLPEGNHTNLSKNITVYFAKRRNVTDIQFGRGNEKVEIMKYSLRDTYLRVSFGIDSTDEQLEQLIETVTKEYNEVKIKYFDEYIANQLIDETVEEVVS